MQIKLTKVAYYLSLIRVQQWVKNLFVFLPMFFNKQLVSFESLFQATIAFISFSLIASSIYCFNDIVDVDFDRKHRSKKERPIASGIISIFEARICMVICAVSGLVVAYFFNGFNLLWVLISYVVINVFYTLIFKNIIVLDVTLIAVSFLLRVLAGGVATNTKLSLWILVMVALLSLFLAFAKRREEVLIYLENKVLVRKNIYKYGLKPLNVILRVLSFLIIVLYLAYTISPETKLHFGSNYIWVTTIFVALGILRYNRLIWLRKKNANPTKILLKDMPMQLIVIGWIFSFFIIIYT